MALVSQNNIPQSGQIKKPKGNPELGNSHIQSSLGTPPSQGTIDNFENPTKKSTWKSENKEITLNNGQGTITHGIGVPDTTIAWNVSNTGQDITMDYSPIGDGGSRIQQNLSDDVYNRMSFEQQRLWSGPKAALWNAEPHIIVRPDNPEAALEGNDYTEKLQQFGISISPQDAVRYGRHLLSPRGLEFLANENVRTKKNPYEEGFDGNTLKAAENFSPKTFNPLAVYVSRVLPAHMVRYTDPKYGELIDTLIGATPLRALALEGLQRIAENMKIKLPGDTIKSNLEKVADEEITLGQGVSNIAISWAEGKAIQKSQQYGKKLLNNLNRKEKGSAVSDKEKPPAKEKEPNKLFFPSDYRDNKPYASFTTWKNIHFGEPNRSHWLGMQIFNYNPLQSDVYNRGIPMSSTAAWNKHFQENGIKYTVQTSKIKNRQYGYEKAGFEVGADSSIYAPDNDGTAGEYFNKYGLNEDFQEKYDKVDKISKHEAKHEKLHNAVYDGETKELSPLQAPVDNTGATFLTKNWNHSEKKYQPTGEPTLDSTDDGNVGITQVGVDIPKNQIIRKTATQTAHIDGKSPDKDGNYSKGTEIIDKYKAHLYGEIAENRNPANVNTWGRSIENVNKTNHIKMGTAGRAAPGDTYLGDVINKAEIQTLDSLDKSGEEYDDSIVFKIKIMNTKELIVLRAFIEDVSDSVTPNWTSINYVGKPDPVYVYKGAERKVTLKFSLISFTKEEHKILWNKANKLLGLNYPSYAEISGGGKRMVPPMIRLTIGDYISDQPGVFENINITPRDNSPWEIEKGSQLPMHLDVNASFIYIGDHLPDLENPKFYNIDGVQKTKS